MIRVRYKAHDYVAERRPDLAIAGLAPWCIEVDSNLYQVGSDLESADREARAFLRSQLTNSAAPRTPVFLATKRWPLLVSIDGVTVRAYPQFVARGTGASTFLHPTLGRRVGTERGPVWIFEAQGRRPSECGTTTAEETISDVIDLATVWLRSQGQQATEPPTPA